MKFRLLIFLIFKFLFLEAVYGQALFIQWTDSHSTLFERPQQVLAIEKEAKDFRRRHPNAEIIVYVGGDHTSITPLNRKDADFQSLEILGLLKSRGYTVLYVPGNHDAFDWNSPEAPAVDLFLDQMERIKALGVEVFAQNFTNPNPRLRAVLTDYYRLKSISKPTYFTGLTLPKLLKKSNLDAGSAKKLFGSIEAYKSSLRRILIETSVDGSPSQLILGVHEGHVKNRKRSKVLSELRAQEGLYGEVSLIMGGHDHRVASYRKRGIHFSNAGSHGSISSIELDSMGQVKHVRHVSISQDALRHIQAEHTEGLEVVLNKYSPEDALSAPWFGPVYSELYKETFKERGRLQTVLVDTQGVPYGKQDLKAGRNDLGSVLAGSLEAWARSFSFVKDGEDVVAFFNSSAYRVEDDLKAGPLTENSVRNIYPFLTHAALVKLSGEEVSKLFFSLRHHYSIGNPDHYSPQLNFPIREREGGLQVLKNGKWESMKPNKSYWLALDGWLAQHLSGEGYQIKDWLEILKGRKVFASESFQEVLVKHFPKSLTGYEQKSAVTKVFMCRAIL